MEEWSVDSQDIVSQCTIVTSQTLWRSRVPSFWNVFIVVRLRNGQCYAQRCQHGNEHVTQYWPRHVLILQQPSEKEKIHCLHVTDFLYTLSLVTVLPLLLYLSHGKSYHRWCHPASRKVRFQK
jgi:hypothetical protein